MRDNEKYGECKIEAPSSRNTTKCNLWTLSTIIKKKQHTTTSTETAVFYMLQHDLPLSVIPSNTPLKNDVNCCKRDAPRTNGDDLSTTIFSLNTECFKAICI